MKTLHSADWKELFEKVVEAFKAIWNSIQDLFKAQAEAKAEKADDAKID
ncbi:MAG: hypothetical protein IJ766_04770 [Clostridia bacterium]|nr:hypothetical protein [Clostridia bacterium]